MTQMMISKSFVHFAITHNISSSKGWGRYKAAANGCPLVQSSTGNEWVSAAHSGEIVEGSTITATLQTMERVGKMKKETTFDTRAEADGAVYVPETNDACADCGSTGHNSGSNTCPGPNEQDRLEAM